LRFTIGAVGTDLVLADPTVSAVHCELSWEERGLRVRDLGSKNGVVLGGCRVLDAFVKTGDTLQLGGSSVRVDLLDEAIHTTVTPRTSLGALTGGSLPMRRLYDQLARVAASDVSVLLQGETGTGKELAATTLVDLSPRREGPRVIVDCGSIPAGVAESELFGHERGAFTGAERALPGVFERAHGGTLILDSVGDLPLELQSRLLGVLERGEIQRVGGVKVVPVDVRVVATSQVELERLVNQGRFRADLFYRLAGVQLRVPTLHEHAEDIPELVVHFLSELGARPLPAAAMRALCEADYPGNVRQLRSAVERAVLGLEAPQSDVPRGAAFPIALDRPLLLQRDALAQDFERRYLQEQLEACAWNVSEAARRAGIDRMHLHRLLQRYGLTRRRGRAT
jgi:DNA-binding NtrC family response regulator